MRGCRDCNGGTRTTVAREGRVNVTTTMATLRLISFLLTCAVDDPAEKICSQNDRGDFY
jgi:hypothetical protein